MLLETQTDGFVGPDPACLPPGHTLYSRESARKHGYVAQIDLQGETERNSFYRLEGEFYNEYRPPALPNPRCSMKSSSTTGACSGLANWSRAH